MTQLFGGIGTLILSWFWAPGEAPLWGIVAVIVAMVCLSLLGIWTWFYWRGRDS